VEQSQGGSLIPLVILLVVYVYFAICLSTLAKKTGHENRAWWGWIPVLNAFLMIFIAGKQWWWFILLMIPLVNIVISVIIWMEISKARNKPAWLGVLMILPVVNLVIPGYLAFSN